MVEPLPKSSKLRSVVERTDCRRSLTEVISVCGMRTKFFNSYTLQPPLISIITTRLQQADTFLDLGSCMGQASRVIADAGAPTENLFAVDLTSESWELSFELFRYRQKMKGRFIEADFTSHDCLEVPGLRELVGRTELIHARSFFHLFR